MLVDGDEEDDKGGKTQEDSADQRQHKDGVGSVVFQLHQCTEGWKEVHVKYSTGYCCTNVWLGRKYCQTLILFSVIIIHTKTEKKRESPLAPGLLSYFCLQCHTSNTVLEVCIYKGQWTKKRRDSPQDVGDDDVQGDNDA